MERNYHTANKRYCNQFFFEHYDPIYSAQNPSKQNF